MMKRWSVIALVASMWLAVGCSSLFRDPLRVAYESGKISKEEYRQRCLERDAEMARKAPAHWELQQTFSENRTKLTPE